MDRDWKMAMLAALGFPLTLAMGYALSNKPAVAQPAASPERAPPRAKVALDCNRPQGHHRWTGDMIVPQDGTVMRVTNGDSHEDLDIAGWLCVIDAEPAGANG